MDEIARITQNEAEVTAKFNKTVELCKQIPKLRHETYENEKQASLLEVKLEQLKQECVKLEIDAELHKKKVEFQKRNVAAQIQILHEEKEQLEGIQQEVWKEMKGFINEVNGRTFSSGRDEALKILEMRAVEKANRSLKTENLKLEGEIYALNAYRKFQERQLSEMENQIKMKECKVESFKNNRD